MEELEQRCTEESRNEDATYGKNRRAGGGRLSFMGLMSDGKAETRETDGLWKNEVKRHR